MKSKGIIEMIVEAINRPETRGAALNAILVTALIIAVIAIIIIIAEVIKNEEE